MRHGLIAAFLVCTACNVSINEGGENASAGQPDAVTPAPAPGAFEVVTGGQPLQPSQTLSVQVALDRRGFSPGVIDGAESASFKAALRGFQVAHELPETGAYDRATAIALREDSARPATALVRIPASFANAAFVPDLPTETAKQAGLPALGYRDIVEMLAERFHTTPAFLRKLNPQATWAAGSTVHVPNIENADVSGARGADKGWPQMLGQLGVAASQPEAERIVVDRSEGVLKVYGAQDRLIAQFPATMGSRHDPLPIGTWTIKGVSWNPPFHYNPDLFWDASSKDEKALLQPGPNGPVGVAWIDISKPHYGIHGTPEPELIGKSESHGCIRLTNWDAARLAQMVKPGVSAVFQQ